MSHFTIGIVGNPNCGKTTLFNVLTGSNQQVGNWPGVTVDRKVGYYQHTANQIEIVDLPGIYSLDVAPGTTSLDEQISQDYILSGEAHLIVNIVDASNLERNLYLTTQLLEMHVPMIIAVNMTDIAKQRGIQLNLTALSQQLGVQALPISATKREGIEILKQAIDEASRFATSPNVKVEYPPAIEHAIAILLPSVRQQLPAEKTAHARWISLKLLENDDSVKHFLQQTIDGQVTQLQEKISGELEEDIDILVADSRYTFISTLIHASVKKTAKLSRTLSDRIDQVVLNRLFGIPIFLLVMYLMFMFTINIGGAFVDFFEIFVGTLLVEGVGSVLDSFGAPAWLHTLLASGVGGGIQVVATFIPIIGFLYLFLSFLEDSGYMARAAFVMDRFMRFIGLPGKSFVPLIVGFGCNVPAVMATRTLESRRDRILTIMMTPFMSCGARLPVYALFAAAFFPVGGQNLVFGLYLFGIAIAVVTGLIMKMTLFKGEASPFVMELPPYHLPTLYGMILRTWDRLKNFIFRAGQVIVPMVILIAFLNSWGTDGSFGNENSNKSVLSEIGRNLTPAFEPMGIQAENWPATVGIFTGILAKEVVVGTLDAIYSQLAATDAGEHANSAPFDLQQGLYRALRSIPNNLSNVAANILDPLGLRVIDKNNLTESQGVHEATFGAMATRFDGQAGAFAYLLFILLYMPCVATVAVIYRETNLKITLLVSFWSTSMAYGVAVSFYQLANMTRHPLQSLSWILGFAVLFVIIVVLLRHYGSQAVLKQ
jgi:ferrous iron transport protein B